MEVFGLILAGGFGLIASPIYCLIVAKLVKRSARWSAIVFYGAIAILALLVATLVPTLILGITATQEMLGRPFDIMRGFYLLLAAPALGAALLLGKKTLWWPLTAGLCWFVGFAGILANIYISEMLYGVDSQGAPGIEFKDRRRARSIAPAEFADVSTGAIYYAPYIVTEMRKIEHEHVY